MDVREQDLRFDIVPDTTNKAASLPANLAIRAWRSFVALSCL